MRTALFALLCALTGLPAFAQTTVNLSHDLVRLGIASQNLTPNQPTLDAQPLLTAAIQYAQNHGGGTLTADTGSYYFLTSQNSVLYVFFGAVSNITLNFNNSHLYFKDGFIRAFEVDECQHVTLENFTIDSLNPRYTQVQLTSINPDTGAFTYIVPAGWPDPATFTATQFGNPQLFAAFFRNGNQIPATGLTFISYPITRPQLNAVLQGEPWTQPRVLGTLRPGDMAAVWDRSGLESISVYAGDFITLSNIEVHGSGGGFAVAVGNSSNSVADNVRIKPRPGGLIASNADGIHFSFSLRNNHIRNCYVTRTTDDALAMDSDFLVTVVRQPNRRQLVTQRNFFDRFSNGTLMNFVHLANAAEVTGGVVVAQNPPDSPNVTEGGTVTLTFDRDLPALSPGDEMVFADADMRGGGSTIEDNTVETIPVGRGLYLGGLENVTVQRNVIRGTSNAGINVEEATVPAGGGGLPAHGITIQDNSVVDVLGPQASGAGGTLVNQAAIIVDSQDENFDFVTSPVNSGVRLLRNFVAGSGRGGLWIGELADGNVADNVVVRWNRYPNLPAWVSNPFPGDFAEPLAIHYSGFIANSGNIFDAQSTLTGPVSFTPSEVSLPKAASSGSFTVATNVPNFAWATSTQTSWLAVSGGSSGQGIGTVSYSADANTSGSPRVGIITVAGVNFIVRQSGN